MTAEFQPTLATAISLGLEVGVGPVDAAGPVPDFAAVTSSGAMVATPDSSMTVMATADAAVVVTVTLPVAATVVALAAYHISWSDCFPAATAVARAHVFPALSLTTVTAAVPLTLRTFTTAASRSPLVVSAPGVALSCDPCVVRAALKLRTTPSGADVGCRVSATVPPTEMAATATTSAATRSRKARAPPDPRASAPTACARETSPSRLRRILEPLWPRLRCGSPVPAKCYADRDASAHCCFRTTSTELFHDPVGAIAAGCSASQGRQRCRPGELRLMFGGVLDYDFAERVVDVVLRGFADAP
ncbi:MAG: hypothetical protein DLM65_01070 [Candidatus Aeolococcus gillhamiae]|uniref:Uncharacterized protein n=1 Tax=Candidatus Aeolococcus gillhamiae TaxID=3127015 RepID=A0A2W5ZIN5_9BACT|nr:MAG: hypothetical protein DLM65_01070 [Candidatus Dormibacter sp. RRmetagenome_bin12]